MDSPHIVAGSKKKNTVKKTTKKGKGIFRDVAHGAVDILGSIFGANKKTTSKKKAGAMANVIAGAKKAVSKADKDKKTEKKKLEKQLKDLDKKRKKIENTANKKIAMAEKKLEQASKKLMQAGAKKKTSKKK